MIGIRVRMLMYLRHLTPDMVFQWTDIPVKRVKKIMQGTARGVDLFEICKLEDCFGEDIIVIHLIKQVKSQSNANNS